MLVYNNDILQYISAKPGVVTDFAESRAVVIKLKGEKNMSEHNVSGTVYKMGTIFFLR